MKIKNLTIRLAKTIIGAQNHIAKLRVIFALEVLFHSFLLLEVNPIRRTVKVNLF
jgi:hypothetical protein